ncbi:MAG: DUF3426 domain-containing protein [Gammaproteobacteria bacterium]|jgi:predicted Zn finger-like uncharacterized protein|nr:DUF3426 domain-containing protein [Gammaproteobacteria bacterium]|tara:strand:- start:5081 stop:6358 length:1278 start_codon:yes stop_codon:yes gene_type:complete
MALRVTQCPGCESTFNTSARVLEAAEGFVRCGACLNVFEATANFTDEAANQAEHSPEDSVFVTGAEEYFNPAAFLTRSALTESLDESTDGTEADTVEQQTEPAEILPDEMPEPQSVAEVIEEDLQEAGEQIDEPVDEPEVSAAAVGQIDEIIDEPEESAAAVEQIDEPVAELSGASTEEFAAPPGEEETTDPIFYIETTEVEASEDIQAHSDEQASEDDTELVRAKALETELEDETALEALPQKNLAAIEKVSYPLELESKTATRVGRRLLTFAAVLLLLGTLGTQVLLLEMEQLSQSPRFRPLYEQACQWISCELPVFVDNSAIRSDSLLVRSHPEIPDAQEVTIIFHNGALFPQPFPLLQLGFTDLNNQLVALREFTADEYLDPGLRDVSLMPVQSPVQITLEIVDPGPAAINYSVSFRSREE